ncbi:MAG TPA: asparagine synthetase B [Bacteroidetes bacterium]|nr:asparagine synthetase B [Bacteroidota bacterium]
MILFTILIGTSVKIYSQQILIPMDVNQNNHLKAYGLIYNVIKDGGEAQWLLNYRGGSFLAPQNDNLVRNARIKGISIENISDAEANRILMQIEGNDVNMAAIPLEKAPRIAVYTPDHALPWDDAVTLALTYAEVEYTKIYNNEVLAGDLSEYDWLHLHHEDFTGQYGKFWASFRNTPWYQRQVRDLEEMARNNGFNKVSDMNKQVVNNIRDFIANGGYLFAMCSGTDTFDIALSAEGVDIVPTPFDGDPMDPDAQNKLNFDRTLAFENFIIVTDPIEYRHANIDIPVRLDELDQSMDFFTLFDFSAKWDPVPTMLTQNHVSSVRGFYGQTTAYKRDKIKNSVVILGESPGRDEVKYLHGNYGQGTFTFYGGHDPEDYTHRVGDPPTDLNLHPNSPGYRLILNNVLFPAAQKKKQRT